MERALQVLSVVILFSALVFFVVTAHAQSGTPCHSIHTTTDVPSGFGSPLNLFSERFEQTMTVECFGEASAVVTIGNSEATHFIYKYGYRKVDGKWLKTTFSGSKQVGPWFIGSATAHLEGVSAGENGSVLAYLCQKVGGRWKCGCEDARCSTARWNIQKYELPEQFDEAPTLNNEAIENESTATLVTENENTTVTNILTGFGGETEYGDMFDIRGVSKTVALGGETITLNGMGFDTNSNNDILWNGTVYEEDLNSSDGTSLTITVPDLSPGKYEVYVKKGATRSDYPTFIWIGDSKRDVPRITHIDPLVGAQGAEFTIHGEGFTDNNDIITTFGVLEGLVSDDGTSIRFSYDPYGTPTIFYKENGERYYVKQPIYTTVINVGGQSEMEVFYLDV